MLVSEAFKQYAQDVIAFRGQSYKTEENHYICMRSLIAFTNDIAIEDLSFRQIRDWKLYLDTKCGPSTVRCYIIKLRVVLAYLRRRGLDVVDPETIPVPKRADTVPAFLSEAQVAQCILATGRVKNKAIVSLLYASGIRVSELCTLNRDAFHDGSFTVIGKGNKARLCFIDERTNYLVAQYLASRTDNLPALFLSDSGKRISPSAVQETFKTISKQTGIAVHPHTMRHSFATNLLRNNTNLRYVQEFLGHSSIQTTQMYSHVIDQDLRAIYQSHHTV